MHASGAGRTDRTVLVARGFEMRGLTRDPTQPAARELGGLGVEMVEGDLYEPGTLEPLVAGVDGVFGVSDFWSEGYRGQVRQVTNLARASAEAGVEHFVFSGVGGSDRDTGVPHFESCDEIEGNLRELGLPATFLRPVFFMQNFEPFYEDIVEGTLALAVEADTRHQMIDLEDIGRVAGQVFADMFQWFIDEGYRADIERMNEIFGPLTTLRAYLEREGWSTDKAAPSTVPSWAETAM